MAKVEIGKPAPDFSLIDFRGKPMRLSELCGEKFVLLVFNRGFV